MSRTREYRIKQAQLKKREARKRAIDNGWSTSDKHIGMLATTPHPCSAQCCGNCRKYEGPTIQELKHTIDPCEVVIEKDVA